MPKPTKIAVFAVCSFALLANSVFVVVATGFNLFISVPVAVSALYLAYVVAEFTVLPGPNE
jgi:hypothetical protein